MPGIEEIFDVCDENDRVIGRAPRSAVHAQKMLHRAVHVFVLNSCGELLLQRRSASKDEFPLTLTSSASGHLSAGEAYNQAAVRELREEIGLEGALEELTSFPASVETSYEHTKLFRLITDDTPQPDPGEILALETVTLAEAEQRLASNPDDFSPPLRVLLKWYFEHCADGQPKETPR